MPCAICETRKPRRACPARGDICAQCCGEQREVTIDCPLDCEHLIEARKHEKPAPVEDHKAMHPEVEVTEAFLERNDMLMTFISVALRDGALSSPESTDADMREAMEAMIQTYKTAGSGLIYETKPENPFAARIQRTANERIAELQRLMEERAGTAVPIRDNDFLRVLVYLARVALVMNNRRRKGRPFISMLVQQFPPKRRDAAQDLLIGGGEGSLLITP